MELKYSKNIIIFFDGENSFEVFKASDGDITFMSEKPDITFKLNLSTRNPGEWKSYELFSDLMKRIVGNYILSGDENSDLLPNDFVDLRRKKIIWHSDGSTDNELGLSYSNSSITIEIIRDKKASQVCNNAVRIRTDGSSYGNYHFYFTEFYNQLLTLAQSLNPPTINLSEEHYK